MFSDPFQHSTDSLIAPAKNAFAITPDDAVNLTIGTKAVYIGNGGDLTVRLLDANSDVTFANVSAGSILDIRCLAVRATGTTASDIVGLA